MNSESENRVVITGIGLVTPCGPTRESSWQAIIRGERAIRTLQPEECLHYDHQTVSAWPDLGIGAPRPAAIIDDQFADPVIALAAHAAEEALADANLSIAKHNRSAYSPERIGCVIGTSKGGLHAYSRMSASLAQHHEKQMLATLFWPACWPNAAAVHIAQTYGISGPVSCPVAACATGLVSIMQGVELIASGQCDCVLAGSSDAALHAGILASFHRLGVLSRQFRHPEEACRPFDRNRTGFAVGEGAAVFVLESAEQADSRNQSSYGQWIGGGLACDPTGITEMDSNSVSLTHLINSLLQQTDLKPRDIDYVNLHGTATRQNDFIEATALRNAFGPISTQVSCSSIKGAIGHLLGAAGSVELAFALLAMRDGVIPPTMNFAEPDPECPLNITPNESQKQPVNQIMKLSLGFGGHLAGAVIRKSANSR